MRVRMRDGRLRVRRACSRPLSAFSCMSVGKLRTQSPEFSDRPIAQAMRPLMNVRLSSHHLWPCESIMTRAAHQEADIIRLRRLGIDTYQELVVFMARSSPVCRSEGWGAQS